MDNNSIYRIIYGLLAGTVILLVDRFLLNGEGNTVVTVILIILFSAYSGKKWSLDGWIGVILIWFINPFSHLVQYSFDLAINENTLTLSATLKLFSFTFFMSLIGFVTGLYFSKK